MNPLDCQTYWRELQRLHLAACEVLQHATCLLLVQLLRTWRGDP